MLPGAKKDPALINDKWQKPGGLIDGVVVREVLHVPRDHGIITELYRADWDGTGMPVVHAYQSRLYPGAIGAWSCHAKTIDRLFVNAGNLKVVLYDGREKSATHGHINEIYAGDARPTLLILPIGVWHGLQNLGGTDALIINFPTRAYDYDDPDHYRLPFDSPEIPYAWNRGAGAARLRHDAKRS